MKVQDAAFKPGYSHVIPTFWKLAGSRTVMTEGQRLAAIRTGFDVSWAEAAKLAFGMSAPNLGRLLNLSVSTFERHKKNDKPLDPVASERLDRLAMVAMLAKDVFETSGAAAQWMAAPNEALGGNTPVMLCETEIGAGQVRRVLHALEWGGAA